MNIMNINRGIEIDIMISAFEIILLNTLLEYIHYVQHIH